MSQTILQHSTVFVGREKEITQLNDMISAVFTTKCPKVVFVQGEYGVGKTELVKHCLQMARTQYKQLVVGCGKYTMEKETGGYGAFGEALGQILHESKSRNFINIAEFAVKVAPAWVNLIPVVGGAVSAAMTTLDELRKLAKPQETFAPQAINSQFLDALTSFSKNHPVILFLDDLQWADEASIRLLFFLSSKLTNGPILIIAAYRPTEALETGENAELFREIHANMRERLGAVEISLERGVEEDGIDVKEYVAKRYPKNNFPEDLAAKVQQHTRGYPLFISQLFSWWEETGLIRLRNVSEDAGWELQGEVNLHAVPDQVGEIIDARIKMTSAQMQNILKNASIEGEIFTGQVIRDLLDLSDLLLAEELNDLEKKYGLVEYKSMCETGAETLDLYQFLHRFYRERIYFKHLNPPQKRILHGKVGEKLEQLYQPQTKEMASQLTRHFAEACSWKKAAKYSLEAATYEFSRSSWLEAVKLCKDGLSYLNRLQADPETNQLRVDLIETSADTYYYLSQFAKAEAQYREAIQLAEKLGTNPEQIATLYEKTADSCWFLGNNDEMMPLINSGKQVLAKGSIPYGETHIRLEAQEASYFLRMGENELVIQSLQRILTAAEKLPSTHKLEVIKVRIYNWLGIALSNVCRYQDSASAYLKAIQIADKAGAKVYSLTSLLNLAYDLITQGNFDASAPIIEKGIETAKRLGDLDNEANARSNKVNILLAQGKPQEAINEINLAMAVLGETSWQTPFFHADLALANMALSNIERAAQEAFTAVESARDIGDPEIVGYALGALAEVEAARQDWSSAARYFEESINVYQESGNVAFAAKIQRKYAEVLLSKGEKPQAQALLQSAIGVFRELGLTNEVMNCEKTLYENLI